MLKFLGVGLSRTGTKSLRRAMELLGFRAKHWYEHDKSEVWPFSLSRIVLGLETSPDFREIYDDCDFINDLPHALFYSEIEKAHPGLKYILTVRDPEAWFRSMVRHYGNLPLYLQERPNDLFEAAVTQRLAYGTGTTPPDLSGFFQLPEFLYKKRLRDWNASIEGRVHPSRLLVIDVTSAKTSDAEKWRMLCSFVGRDAPNEPFPHE